MVNWIENILDDLLSKKKEIVSSQNFVTNLLLSLEMIVVRSQYKSLWFLYLVFAF